METLAAEENKDLAIVSEAASFVRTLKEKEVTLRTLTDAQKNLEEEYKNFKFMFIFLTLF